MWVVDDVGVIGRQTPVNKRAPDVLLKEEIEEERADSLLIF
jgi:hypothetical protein